MVVEDDAIIALQISSALERLGYVPVGVVSSYSDAIEMAEREHPNAALVDIGLREKEEGIRTAAALRHKMDITVIFLTAYTDPDTLEKARQAEPFGYIAKPFDPRSLHATIEMALHRHLMERELKASEERYRYLLENMSQGVIHQDNEGSILSANPAACALLGMPANQIVGTSWSNPEWHFIREDGARFSLAELPPTLALKTGQAVRDVVFGIRRSGVDMPQWIRVSAIPIFLPGEPLPHQVFSTIADITELKQAEIVVEKNAREIRALVEHMPDIVTRFDRELRYTYASPVIKASTGLAPEMVLHKTNRELGMPSDLVDLWDTATRKVFESGQEETFSYIFSGLNGDRHFESRLIPEFGPDGQVQSVLDIDRDVTDLRLAEEKLRRSEGFLRQLIQEAPVAAGIFNKNNQFEFLNRQFNLMFGYSLEDFADNRSWESRLFPDPADLKTALSEGEQALNAATQNGGYLPVLEKRMRAKDGSSKDVKIHGVVLHEKIFLMFEDITPYREAQERMALNLAEKDALLREVHHRVKNNLQVVVSLLGLQSAQTNDPATRELFFESQNRIRSMALVHENLYRSDSGAKINFGSYLNDLVAGITASLPIRANVNIRIDAQSIDVPVDTAIPCGLIVNELVTNAYKYAFPKNAAGMVTVTLRHMDGSLLLEVSDDGVGLPADLDLENLSSLGLNLVQILSRQVEGELTICREAGTRVSLLLPEMEG